MDDSWGVLKSIQQGDSSVVLRQNVRNHGQVRTVIHGWSVSRGRFIVTLSADLQDPPEIIPEMLESLAQGSDLVIGNRSSRSDPKIF